MINLIIDVKAGYDFKKQFVVDRAVSINPTNFLLDKLSITEAELDKLGTSAFGTWKIKHILTHLNFFKVLETRLRDGYIDMWFKNIEAVGEFKMEITNAKYIVVRPKKEVKVEAPVVEEITNGE